MTLRSRVLLSLISVAVAGALAACGGSSAVTGPEMTGATPTATITGTVVSASAAGSPTGDLSSRSANGGLRVSVVGTALETTTDEPQETTTEETTLGFGKKAPGLTRRTIRAPNERPTRTDNKP